MSENIRRFGSNPLKHLDTPGGTYVWATDDKEILTRLGRIVVEWANVEMGAIQILSNLLGADGYHMSTQVFYAIINQKTRIDLMNALLAESIVNKEKSIFMNCVIDKYASLAKRRNKFIHARYEQHLETGNVYVSALSPEHFAFTKKRKLSYKELDLLIDDIETFMRVCMWILQYENHPESLKKRFPDTFALFESVASGEKPFQQLWEKSKNVEHQGKPHS